MQMYIIDNDVKAAIRSSNIKDGHILIFVTGVTGGVTLTEGEPGIMTHDLEYLFSYGMKAPYGEGFADGTPYKHHETWGCDNGASHLRSLMIGPSVIVPFQAGKLLLGPWQNIILVECDTHDRERKVVFQIQGE